jgi:hypothetical protein
MIRATDVPRMPGTGETAVERLDRSVDLANTRGQVYVERRGVPLRVAQAAGVRFDPDFNGRPAVLVPMREQDGSVLAVHGRYLHTVRGQDKMLTVGLSGGVVTGLAGWRAEPLIVVEGLFDALTLATCGWSSVATIGRWAAWLPDVAAGRVAWLAFDANRPGAKSFADWAERLHAADVRRLLPPPPSQDWSAALVSRGRAAVARWLVEHTGIRSAAR